MFLLQNVATSDTSAAAVYGNVVKLTAPPSSGSAYNERTFQGILKTTSGTASSTATMVVQVSNDPIVETSPTTAAWITLGTIALSGSVSPTSPATDGIATNSNWRYVRGYIAQNGVTGTNAVASLIFGG